MNRFPFRWPGKQNKSPEKAPSPIKSLEEMQGVHPRHKSAVLGIHLDLKPAALVTVSPGDEGMQAFARFEKTLSALGLTHERILLARDTNLRGAAVYAISKNAAITRELGQIYEKREQGLDHARIGALLGYPETAIDAFAQGKGLTLSERDELLSVEDSAFLHFNPSRAHWAEEVEANRPFLEGIQRIAPDLYRGTIESEAESRRTPGAH